MNKQEKQKVIDTDSMMVTRDKGDESVAKGKGGQLYGDGR